MPRNGRPGRTAEKDEKFFAALASGEPVGISCAVAGYSRTSVYEYRDADPDFAARWQEANETALERLEREADRRAVTGLLRKKFLRNGEPIIDPVTGEQYEELEYSDNLLMFRMKRLDPTHYRDNARVELTGDEGKPIQTEQTLNLAGLADPELRLLLHLLTKAQTAQESETGAKSG